MNGVDGVDKREKRRGWQSRGVGRCNFAEVDSVCCRRVAQDCHSLTRRDCCLVFDLSDGFLLLKVQIFQVRLPADLF